MATSSWQKVLLTLISVFLLPGNVARTKAQATESPALCYAFLNGNDHQASDLYVSCEGKKERITKLGDIWDFAVAADGSPLALRRQRGTEPGYDSYRRPIRIPHFEIEVVSLKPDFQTRWSPVYGRVSLYPYCGTILAEARLVHAGWGEPLKVTYRTYNVLTGQPFSLPPYVDFGCSADGKTVVGYLDAERDTLWAGMPPQREVAHAAQDGVISAFGISPNGRYVAYGSLAADLSLCVDKDGESSRCVPAGSSGGKLSVSDSGGVLYDGETGEVCNDWPCEGVYYWQAGTPEPKIVEAVGWYAQWITPDVATALRAWGSHLSGHGPPARP